MKCEIVDTNVILIANGQHQDVSPNCVAACALRLEAIMQGGRLAIDDRFLIIGEYLHKTTPKLGKRSGDVFLKWVLNNNANVDRIDQIPISQHPVRGFETFPDDPALSEFDAADRKFIAVACAHPDKPPILQAADSKWLDWYAALSSNLITVDFLCPADIERFQANRIG